MDKIFHDILTNLEIEIESMKKLQENPEDSSNKDELEGIIHGLIFAYHLITYKINNVGLIK